MKKFVAVTAIVLSALLLTGCARGGMDASSSGGEPMVAQPESGFAADSEQSADSPTERSVITTGTVSVTVDDPIAGAEAAATLVDKAGGRVDSRSENPATDSNSASASLTLRIPADDFDKTLTQLKELGTVNYVSLNAADVTQQVDDIDARIAALKTSVKRLTELMAKAETTADLIAIEESLSARQVELDGLVAQSDYLDDQIDFSTISLELYSVGTVAPGDPDNFWSGFVSGWNTLLGGLSALLVGIGFMLPGVLLLALLAAIALAIIMPIVRSKRRRKQATIDAWHAEQARIQSVEQPAPAASAAATDPQPGA